MVSHFFFLFLFLLKPIWLLKQVIGLGEFFFFFPPNQSERKLYLYSKKFQFSKKKLVNNNNNNNNNGQLIQVAQAHTLFVIR